MAKIAVANSARFCGSYSGRGLQKKVAKFTRAYESARFGKSADDAQSLPEPLQGSDNPRNRRIEEGDEARSQLAAG